LLGPIAQANAASTVTQVAAAQPDGAGAGAEATALAGAAAAGAGAAIVLIISFYLASLASDQDGSTQTQEIAQLSTDIQDIENAVLASYWQDKLGSITNFWIPLQGDLDNLASQGTRGNYVIADVGDFHSHAMDFLNNLIPSDNPGAQRYWQRPLVQSQAFTAQQVPYPANQYPLSTIGWYGVFLKPEPGMPLGGSGQEMVLDPTTILPFLGLAIRSYLTIQAIVNLIDPTQPRLDQFVDQYRGDLKNYADFLQTQYKLGVNGIMKSGIPFPPDIKAFASYITTWFQGVVIGDDTEWWGGSFPYLGPDWPSPGYAWNGVYGVVHLYPRYGAYEPTPPVPVPLSSPSVLLDIISTGSIVDDLKSGWYTYGASTGISYFSTMLNRWTVPWARDRVILGIMARWKTIYI